MTDFGSLFDAAKGEADKERAEKYAKAQAIRDEKKAQLDQSMRPILEIVDPVFQSAATQLKTKDVRMKQDVNSNLLYNNGERSPARNYQFQRGHTKPGSTYHFIVLSSGIVTCTVYPYDHQFSVHHSGNQVLRCKVDELTAEKVEEVVRRAINEIARSQ